MMSIPRAILGTMTFGGATSEQIATTMMLDFCNNSKWKELTREDPMIDTAIMYQNGKTEAVLGNIIRQSEVPSTLSIASKANPFTSDKDLSPAGLRKQLDKSLSSLGTDKVDIYYLHAPDAQNPIEPTLEEIQKLYLESKFKRFGLSNFSAWETVYIHNYMSSRNYIKPTVYQGMYNAITRQVETELFPALRKLDMSFYAYNPLAGGMLSGKYSPAEDDKQLAKQNAALGDRFAGNSFWAKRYRERFQQKEQFQALEIVRHALANNSGQVKSMAEASLRWLCHHSLLKEKDGIIIGASKMEHYSMNMESLSADPLPTDLVEAFHKAATSCQSVCPVYSRGYSGSDSM